MQLRYDTIQTKWVLNRVMYTFYSVLIHRTAILDGELGVIEGLLSLQPENPT